MLCIILLGTWSDFLGWAHQGKSLQVSSDDVVPFRKKPQQLQLDPNRLVTSKSDLELSSEHAQKVWSKTKKWEDSPTELTSRIQDVFGIKVWNYTSTIYSLLVILFYLNIRPTSTISPPPLLGPKSYLMSR